MRMCFKRTNKKFPSEESLIKISLGSADLIMLKEGKYNSIETKEKAKILYMIQENVLFCTPYNIAENNAQLDLDNHICI